MQLVSKIVPCLWFDNQAKEAAEFYVSVFKGSRIVNVSHYTDAGREVHGRPAGSVMTVEFEIAGQRFTALNGGPHFKFNEAISLQVMCEDQAEVDYFWKKLSAGGEQVQCGWLKDRFGLSWQVVPTQLHELLKSGDPEQARRVMEAMLKMEKIDVRTLEEAYAHA